MSQANIFLVIIAYISAAIAGYLVIKAARK